MSEPKEMELKVEMWINKAGEEGYQILQYVGGKWRPIPRFFVGDESGMTK